MPRSIEQSGPRRRGRTLGFTAVVAAAALVLTGCGNGSGGNQNAADQSSSSSSDSGSPSSSASPSTTSSAPSSPAPTSSASPGRTPSGSGPSATPTHSSSSATRPGSGAADVRCHTSDLRATVQPQDAAAGNRYATLVLTNTSGKTCRIYGYGGIKLGGNRAVPSSQHRDPGTPPQLVSLPAGGHAYSTLHWGAVQGTGDAQSGQCEPTPTYLLVTPPDETTSLRVAWRFGPVCERGAIDQTAYRAGAGPARPGD